MLTIHTAPLLRLPAEDGDVRPPADRPPGVPGVAAGITGGAVAVEGDRIAAIGPLADLTEAYPGARVRRWPGVLGPAVVHRGPFPDAPSPRERVHALLLRGAAAVVASALDADPDADALRAAVERVRIAVVPDPTAPVLTRGARADLAAFDPDGRCVATVVCGRLVHRRT